ncbi:MAG: putative toxin-antitoxin system toxin component, PIN family [Planctomycetes bacterium]|nr:putative toxin-antitoxin system toxin component, PIN family [Planctomycetota bacterium]
MKVVLDTNVVVSGLISPFGNPADILRMVSSGEIQLCFDARILMEYKEVLRRPKFQFEEEKVRSLLDQIERCGQTVAARPLESPLPDPDDDPFLEVAIAGKADCLVTGNIGHFPTNMRQRVRILPPAKFITFYRKQMKST